MFASFFLIKILLFPLSFPGTETHRKIWFSLFEKTATPEPDFWGESHINFLPQVLQQQWLLCQGTCYCLLKFTGFQNRQTLCGVPESFILRFWGHCILGSKNGGNPRPKRLTTSSSPRHYLKVYKTEVYKEDRNMPKATWPAEGSLGLSGSTWLRGSKFLSSPYLVKVSIPAGNNRFPISHMFEK